MFNMINTRKVLFVTYISYTTLMQCRLSKALFHRKSCIYVPAVLFINFICATCCSYRSLNMTNHICYRHPADIRFSGPTKTCWSRRMKEVDLHVSFHSVNLLNNTNPPLIIVSACDIIVKTHGLCSHSIEIWLSGNIE